ncbi:hypothetical protein KSP39_PZI007789 [Platanthera zijinensis]|uniref:DUF4378 domain-containing protein n=1 Tax=Platanthera zijinensis TaxID=2320716 RepID=A0AAP0G8G5_9ASPA
MAHRSLLLKDYLELESSSESLRWASLQRARPFSGGEITVRRLLETELSGGANYRGLRLFSFRSKDVLSKLSAVIRALQSSADEAPRAAVDAGGALSRSFSKKLRRGFWMKRSHAKGDGKVIRAAVDEKEAASGYFFYSSSPAVCKCNHRSTPRTSESGLTASPTLTPQKGIFAGEVGDDTRRDQKEQCGQDMDCPSEEEKEQLSPVSVMDFPYQEDEDEEVEQPSATSPVSEQSVRNLERTKNQLLQKIRRLESLADLDPLDPNNLFQRSVADHVAAKEEWWRRAACLLLQRLDGVESLTDCGEKQLLFEFFVEGLSCREEWCGSGTTSASGAGDEELLRAANGWLSSGGCKALEGCCEVGVLGMGGGGWRRFKEEEAAVAVEITDGLLRWLMAEFVVELVSAVV